TRSEAVRGVTARPAGEFPFGLGRQAIARALDEVLGQTHPRLDLSNRGEADLVIGQPLLLAEPAAVFCRVPPGDSPDRILRIGAVAAMIGMRCFRVGRQETGEL